MKDEEKAQDIRKTLGFYIFHVKLKLKNLEENSLSKMMKNEYLFV